MEQRLIGLEDQSGRTSVASLLDLEPELAEGLPADVARAARARLVVSVHVLEPGLWDPDAVPRRRRSALGVLVVDGLLSREVTVAGGGAIELLGAGDIVGPWSDADNGLLPVGSTWTVLASAQIAILEPRVVAAMSAWPQVLDAAMLRAGRRAARLAVHQAISQLPRVEQRILTVLWYLAERWGRVASNGVLLSLPLSHGALGGLVGARRPTVSLAVKELGGQDLLSRREDGSWVLHGTPPEDLASVRRAGRRARVVELRSVPSPQAPPPPRLAALVDRIVTLRDDYERNLTVAADTLARSQQVRADSRRVVTQRRQQDPPPAPRSVPLRRG